MNEAKSFHENFQRAEVRSGGSSRSFGWMLAAVLAVVAVRPALGGGGVRWWALALAAAAVFVAIARPALLDWPTRIWLRFGGVLARIVNPVVLAILFVVVITPTALITRALGRDPLRLRKDCDAATYWIDRHAVGTGRIDMRKQF